MRELPLQAGIDRYINHHIPPGDFLRSVICNNLSAAITYADNINIHLLPEYVNYFYNNAPSSCWGSVEKYSAWLKIAESQEVTNSD